MSDMSDTDEKSNLFIDDIYPIYKYDFILISNVIIDDKVFEWLELVAKKWFFISTKINTTNVEYKGYLSLKTRKREETLKNTLFEELKRIELVKSPSGRRPKQPKLKENQILYNSEGIKNIASRVIETQISEEEEKQLVPWQNSIISLIKNSYDKCVHVILNNPDLVDMRSFICDMALKKKFTPIAEAKNIEEFYGIMNISSKSGCYFIKLDTTLEKNILLGICKAIENVAFGEYKILENGLPKLAYMKPPTVFVLVSDSAVMTKNLKERIWKYWRINEKEKLVRF